MKVLEGAILQEAVIIYISLVFENETPVGALFSGSDLYNGDEGSYQACIGGENNDLFDVLAELDNALDLYQEDNPGVKMVEICSDDTMQAMNLMLKRKGLRPIGEDDFNFSDTLFNISNPVLSKQLGYGLPQ